MLKPLLFVCAGAGAGAAWYVALPPARRTLPPAPPGLTQPVRGAIHVHSTRSDGTGDVDDDRRRCRTSRPPVRHLHRSRRRPPRSRTRRGIVDGVLCIDAVEISTENGHVVALGLPAVAVSPGRGSARRARGHRAAWRLRDRRASRIGEAGTAVDGVGIAARRPRVAERRQRMARRVRLVAGARAVHLSRPRHRDAGVAARSPGLDARAMGQPHPLATGRRRRRRPTRTRASGCAAWASRTTTTPARCTSRPTSRSSACSQTRCRDDAQRRRRGGRRGRDRGDPRRARVFDDRRACRSGRDVVHRDERERDGRRRATCCRSAARSPCAIDVQAPPDARVAVLKDGDVMEMRTGPQVELDGTCGAGRVSRRGLAAGRARAAGRPMDRLEPDLRGARRGGTAAARPAARRRLLPFSTRTDRHKAGSSRRATPSLGAIDVVKAVTGTQISLRYGLGGAASASPYAAFVMPAGPDLQKFTQLTFIGRADKPTRVSVQLRDPIGSAGERWHRSVYLDPEPREVTVYFDDMTPRGATSQPAARSRDRPGRPLRRRHGQHAARGQRDDLD